MEIAPFIWAHRGASGLAPENTMAAFRQAELAGADGIELDVHLSRDRRPVVIHDETIDRTTDGSGAVADILLRDLQRRDAGSWFAPEFCGETVPLLEEVLAWAADRIRLNIEIKSPQAGRAVLDLLVQFPQVPVLISSFRHELLFSMRQWSPDLPIAFLSDSCFWRLALKRAVACRAESFHPPERHVTRVLVNACHQVGMKVFPWTVDDTRRRDALLRIGVDGLFTNFPKGEWGVFI